jgi:AraC-like DNA-binding protein
MVALEAAWIAGATSALPLLWLYIWRLTGNRRNWPKRVWLHAVLPVLSVVLFASVFTLPPDDQRYLFTDTGGVLSRRGFVFGFVYETFGLFVVTVQWLVYLILASCRLLRYRARLKDVFASTEDKELRWTLAIIGLCGGYWLLGFALLVLDVFDIYETRHDAPEYALNLVISGVLLVWGLRQRPFLQISGTAPSKVTTTESSSKYVKSALTKAMADRIAAKLRRAMTEDKLYLDPNLSLWALSKHVGVSDNYVSQVLNVEIGQNFFDFVNSYRVKEAEVRLLNSDDTILTIAYDVGFNSRSSFYTAFKKCTGQTPTAFRANAVRPG